MQEAINFGNHKGAKSNYLLLCTLIEDDVTHGYSLPLPLNKIHLLPGILLTPMNIVEQDTIDEHRNTIPKYRLTHNQSFKFKQGSNTSLNSNCIRTNSTPATLVGSSADSSTGLWQCKGNTPTNEFWQQKSTSSWPTAASTCTTTSHSNLALSFQRTG